MARAESTDLMQSFRFHVVAESASGANPLQFTDESELAAGQAGFQSCSLPDYSSESVEYREGLYMYTRKFPGPATVSDVSLMRGVAKRHAVFTDWILTAIKGGEYRCTVTIHHYHREDASAQLTGGTGTRQYICHECMPIRAKPGADLDATSGEISMAECDFALEWFEIQDASGTRLHTSPL